MKKILLSICFSMNLLCFGQDKKTTMSVIQIIQPEKYSLDGGVGSLVNGQSRVNIPITLPKGTVKWYYIFASFADPAAMESAKQKMNLFADLTRVIDITGTTSKMISTIGSPSGANECNVYLLDYSNSTIFYAKEEAFSYQPQGSREKVTDGKIEINDITQGTWYLGIQNPSLNTKLNIALEVVAIVEDVWGNDVKENLYINYFTSLTSNNLDETTAKEIANCIVSKITAQKTPDEISMMTKYDLENLENIIVDQCLGGNKNDEQEKASTYGTLGWKSYENGDIDKCIEYSKKAIAIDKSLGWVQANLGLCYLIKNDMSASTDYYIEAITLIKKDKANAKKSFQEVIKDIDNCIKNIPDIKGYKDIKDLLQSELNNY